jgi:ribosomal protein S27AE
MPKLIRKCSQCGTADRRTSWSSAADAAKDDAFTRPWACGSCAWTEFELVESDPEPANDEVTAGTR